MNQKDFKILLIILAFSFSLFQVLHRMGEEQIKIWDESSAARNAVEMMHSENYLLATINGTPDYYDVKPPAQLWFKVASFKLLGINEFSVRFPTLVAFLLLLLVLFFYSRKYLNSTFVGLMLVGFSAVSYGFVNYHMAWHGDTDILLTLSTTLYILFAFLFIQEYPQKKLKYALLLAFLVSAAYFIKSIAGIAPALGIVIYLIIKKPRILKDYISYLPAGLFILILVIYYSLVENNAPGYLNSLLNNHLMPFKEYPTAPKHPEFIFYIKYLITLGFYPFAYWLPVVIIPLIFSKNKWIKNFLLYILIVAASFLIGQSSALMKNEWYIAPIYPLLWLILSVSIYETFVIFKNKFYSKHKYVKIIPILVLLVIGYYFKQSYALIYQHNDDRNQAYIYNPERDGDFLRKVFRWNQYIDNIVIIKNSGDLDDRQLDFYIKKYRYFENKNISLVREINDDIIGQYVLCVIPELIDQLKEDYHVRLVYKEHYGSLLYIVDSKEKKKQDQSMQVNERLIKEVSDSLHHNKELFWGHILQLREQGHDYDILLYNKAKTIILNDSVLLDKNRNYNKID